VFDGDETGDPPPTSCVVEVDDRRSDAADDDGYDVDAEARPKPNPRPLKFIGRML